MARHCELQLEDRLLFVSQFRLDCGDRPPCRRRGRTLLLKVLDGSNGRPVRGLRVGEAGARREVRELRRGLRSINLRGLRPSGFDRGEIVKRRVQPACASATARARAATRLASVETTVTRRPWAVAVAPSA